jgi:hypothetical protein
MQMTALVKRAISIGALSVLIANGVQADSLAARGGVRPLTLAEMRSAVGGTVYPGYCAYTGQGQYALYCTGATASTCGGWAPCAPGQQVVLLADQTTKPTSTCTGPSVPGTSCTQLSTACTIETVSNCAPGPVNAAGAAACGLGALLGNFQLGRHLFAHVPACP